MTTHLHTTPAITLTGNHIPALLALATAGAHHYNRMGYPLRPEQHEALNTLRNAHHQQQQRKQRPTETQQPQQWITAQQLAQHEGVHVRTIQKRAHQLGGHKHKGTWLFPAWHLDT